MISIPKHLQGILQRAAQAALPGLSDQVVVQPERNKDWHYVSPSAISFFNKDKKAQKFGFSSCEDMANAIKSKVDSVPGANQVIQKLELSMAGPNVFMNIHLKPSFIES